MIPNATFLLSEIILSPYPDVQLMPPSRPLNPGADVLMLLLLLCRCCTSAGSCSPAFTSQALGCFGLLLCSLTSFSLWTRYRGECWRVAPGAASLSPACVCLLIHRQEKSRQVPAFQEALWQAEEKGACLRLRGSQTEAEPLLRERLQRRLLLRWRAQRWSEVGACHTAGGLYEHEAQCPCFQGAGLDCRKLYAGCWEVRASFLNMTPAAVETKVPLLAHAASWEHVPMDKKGIPGLSRN